MSTAKHRKHAGIEVRRTGRGTSYRAEVFDHRTSKRRYKTFPTMAAAKGWRSDTLSAIRANTLAPDTAITVREAANELLAGMESGIIRNRSGQPYKPATLRSYRRAFKLRLLPTFGARKLGDIRRRDVQAFIDKLAAEGLGGSTIRNTIDPLRVVFRRAITRELVMVSPMQALEVPGDANHRDRIADPEEAAKLIAAVPENDRAVWATAMWAGLRRGELIALRWSDVDLAGGVIRVRRNFDPEGGGLVDVKTRAGRRSVPITARLRDVLVEHKLRTGRDRDDLAFGVTATDQLEQSNLRKRARTAWKAAKLRPITLHECRHSFASLGIAAGLNPKALSTYLGHASVAITFDRYGHLFDNAEEHAASQLDAYLLRSEGALKGQSRGSGPPKQPDSTGDNRNDEEAANPLTEPETAL